MDIGAMPPEAACVFLWQHPDKRVTIECRAEGCKMVNLISVDQQKLLKKHLLKCKHCGARFTKIIVEKTDGEEGNNGERQEHGKTA